MKPFLEKYVPIWVSCIIFLFVCVGSLYTQVLNRNFNDLIIKETRNIFDLSGSANKNIVVIGIDEKTQKELGRFPFDRKTYVPLIQHLKNAGASVIAFDIIFADSTEDIQDNALSEAFSGAENIVLGYAHSSEGEIEAILPQFERTIKNAGILTPDVFLGNGKTYSFSPLFFDEGRVYEYFALSILRQYYNYTQSRVVFTPKYDGSYYYVGQYSIPVFHYNGEQKVRINYVPITSFKEFSFIDIYNEESFNIIKEKYDFTDKIIIVGATAEGLKDIFSTYLGTMPGVYVHANALNTILQKEYMFYFNKYVELAIIFLIILLASIFNFHVNGKISIIGNLSIIIVFILLLPIFLFSFFSFFLNYPVEVLLSLILSLGFSNLAKYIIESKEKTKLVKAFSEYVSNDIVKEILSGAGKVNLDGEEKDVTLFFSDIEGFTTISEEFSPEKLVGFLREYLNVMSNVIIDEKGFINKYEGDAIMAIWGAFGYEEQMVESACSASLLQLKLLNIMNQKWEKIHMPHLAIRIGLHIGPVILGNIGARGRKLEYTALGDSVNLASRLEGVNKVYGTHICVSDDIYQKAKGKFIFRFLDTIKVQGKNKVIDIYELLGEHGKIERSVKKRKDIFAHAMVFYKKGEFEKAKKVFIGLQKDGDKASAEYVKRCESFILNPPEGWNGVWEMQEK